MSVDKENEWGSCFKNCLWQRMMIVEGWCKISCLWTIIQKIMQNLQHTNALKFLIAVIKEGRLFILVVCQVEISWNTSTSCYTLGTIAKPLMSKRCTKVVWQCLSLQCKSYWILNNSIKKKFNKIKKIKKIN